MADYIKATITKIDQVPMASIKNCIFKFPADATLQNKEAAIYADFHISVPDHISNVRINGIKLEFPNMYRTTRASIIALAKMELEPLATKLENDRSGLVRLCADFKDDLRQITNNTRLPDPVNNFT